MTLGWTPNSLTAIKTLQAVDQTYVYVTVRNKKSSTDMKRDPREHQGG